MRDNHTSDLFEGMAPEFILYRSGASSIADATGYINARKPVGITALDASEPVLKTVGKYASSGGQVFCDSGAFRAFRSGTPFNFSSILPVYESLILYTSTPSNLLLAGPDKVGNQDASISLLRTYRDAVIRFVDQGVGVVIPLQRGKLSLSESYETVSELLGRPFVVGLPSNAKAIPESEVLDFIKQVQPDRAHFLGCQSSALLHKAAFACPDCVISSDSTRLRSHVGQGRLLTVKHHEKTAELVIDGVRGAGQLAHCDETEMFGYLDPLIQDASPSAVRRLSDRAGLSLTTVKQAANEERVFDVINNATGGYGYYHIREWWISESRNFASPLGRAYAVEHLASVGLI